MNILLIEPIDYGANDLRLESSNDGRV